MEDALLAAVLWITAGSGLTAWVWWLGRPQHQASPKTPVPASRRDGDVTAGADSPDAAPAVAPPRVRVTYRGTYGQVA